MNPKSLIYIPSPNHQIHCSPVKDSLILFIAKPTFKSTAPAKAKTSPVICSSAATSHEIGTAFFSFSLHHPNPRPHQMMLETARQNYPLTPPPQHQNLMKIVKRDYNLPGLQLLSPTSLSILSPLDCNQVIVTLLSISRCVVTLCFFHGGGEKNLREMAHFHKNCRVYKKLRSCKRASSVS